LDLELVPKENRIDIGKCNGRIPRGLTPREPTFQVFLDAIALTRCYHAFLITVDVLKVFPRVTVRKFDPLPSEEDTVSFLRKLGHTGEINSLNDVVVDQMHQPWRTFAALINRSLSGKTSGLDKLRLSRAQIIWRMYFLKNVDYVELLPEMKESKAYKTYLDHATGDVPPKIARKFLNASSPLRKDNASIVFRETPMKTKSTVKERVDVSRGKGIDLLSEVALAEKAQLKEITPTVTSEGTSDKPGVLDVTEDDSTESESESWGNDEDKNNNEQEASDEDSGLYNESKEQESNLEQDEESDDDNQEADEVDQENKFEDDEIQSDEDKGMDDTTDQFDDDVDARLKEPTQTDKEIVQEQVVEDAHVTISTITKKNEVPATSSSRSSDLASKFLNFLDIPHTDAEIVSPLDVHVHHEVPRTQAPTLLTIPVSVITESSPVLTNIPQSSQTFTPPPILTTPTPPPTIETTNPLSTLPDFASVFRFNDRITALEKEVAEIKKDPLHTQVTSLVDEHLDTRLGETREEFMNFLSESLTARIKEQVKNQLPQILPKEVSNFAPPVIEKLIKESRDEVTLAKVSSQPQSTYEAASTLTEFELKKILLDKMEKSESYLTAPKHRDCYDGLKKSYALDKDFFYSYDVYSLKRGRKDKDKDEDPSAGSDRGLKKRKLSKDAEPTTGPKKKDSTSGSSKGTKSQPKSSGKSVQSEEPVFEVADSDMPQDQEGNLGDNEDEPRNETASRRPAFRLLKGTHYNYVELEYDFEECYKALSEKLDWENPEGGDYPFDLSKPLPLIKRGKRIEDMVLNIRSPVILAYDRYALWGISHWRQQRKSFYAYARGIQSRGDVYSTKRILTVTHVKVMRKHIYGYLEEIVVRRADNILYRFKEGDDVADFAIALRMFTRSLVIQKLVEDLQLGVKSYQKKINVTKPDTTRSDLKKRHPYTPYKDPQGFIYVEDYKRNRLMCSGELYKFSDGTLTRLLSSLEDITKNIDIEYLLKRRWSNLEKKRAYFMIKDINKLLKERRMMRSLKKFIGGRLYGTDLRLLQRTI
ncbi:hypothetical protein Tco_0186375, partial [Tanacetum coccineum]